MPFDRQPDKAATWCWAVVATLKVAVAAGPVIVSCVVDVMFEPDPNPQDASCAAEGVVQDNVTVPVNPPFGVTLTETEPDCPGAEMVTPPAAPTLIAPRTFSDCGIGLVADV